MWEKHGENVFPTSTYSPHSPNKELGGNIDNLMTICGDGNYVDKKWEVCGEDVGKMLI